MNHTLMISETLYHKLTQLVKVRGLNSIVLNSCLKSGGLRRGRSIVGKKPSNESISYAKRSLNVTVKWPIAPTLSAKIEGADEPDCHSR